MGKRKWLTLIQCRQLKVSFKNGPKNLPTQTEPEVEGTDTDQKETWVSFYVVTLRAPQIFTAGYVPRRKKIEQDLGL